jgi:imidazolonepropionase-like amidohydrolase
MRPASALLAALCVAAVPAASRADTAADLAAARALFERNIAAIQQRDRDAYLACYREDQRLERAGATGFQLGYAGLAEGTPATGSDDWPDTLIASDLRLTPIADGIVYGTYHYRVVVQGAARNGISERLFMRDGAAWRIAVSTAFDAPAGVPAPPVALVGATLYDGRGGAPLRDAVVIVRNGRIESAGPGARTPVPDGIDRVDLRGRYIVPGLVDTHVHYSQTGWADGRPDAVDVRSTHPYERAMADNRLRPERFHRAFLASGVTAVFDVGGYPWTLGLRTATEDRDDAPHVAATGPLLATRDPDALRLPGERQMVLMSDEAAVRAAVRSNAAQGADAIKVWLVVASDAEAESLAPLVRFAGAQARGAGLPLVVHATTLASARVAVEAGARLLVHSVEDTDVDPDFVAAVKQAGTFYCPTLTVFDGYMQLFAGSLSDPVRAQLEWVAADVRALVLETDGLESALPAGGLAAMKARGGQRYRIMARNLLRLHRAGVPVVLGTDAGNPLTLHGPSVFPELEAMQKAGLSPREVLKAATADAAAAMGRGTDLGVVEAGRIADLLVLDRDPGRDIANVRSIHAVMRAGRLHGRESMRP